jgi:hypothetical protein
VRRRALLRSLAVAPALGLAPALHARDFKDAAELFREIERLTSDVEAHLDALSQAAAATAFVTSAKADLARHRRERTRIVRHAASPPRVDPLDDPGSVPRLHAALTDLVHAHAEGLPALRDTRAVETLAAHMVDLSRLATVVDLWREAEAGDE